mmetsp:Transcript_11490/g.20942  ORF Transcript_11490/g.20942 Transcript_11490/m.20942 type:complete len:204 (-) Transcript_11490:111-722(-)
MHYLKPKGKCVFLCFYYITSSMKEVSPWKTRALHSFTFGTLDFFRKLSSRQPAMARRFLEASLSGPSLRLTLPAPRAAINISSWDMDCALDSRSFQAVCQSASSTSSHSPDSLFNVLEACATPGLTPNAVAVPTTIAPHDWNNIDLREVSTATAILGGLQSTVALRGGASAANPWISTSTLADMHSNNTIFCTDMTPVQFICQ